MNLLDRFFKLKENNTTCCREIYAGVITFLSAAYILAVNPDILSSTGMDRGGIFCATALAAFLGTLLMSLFAKYPLLLAPAMGLNAFFAYSVVATMGYSWQIALFAIVLEGVIFFLLSISSIREKLINAIPMQLKYAMAAGIGLFITLVAFKNAHIIQDHPDTFITMQNFSGESFNTAGISAILSLIGLLITTFLLHIKVAGALLFGILFTWILGIICQMAGLYQINVQANFGSLLPEFTLESLTEPFHSFWHLFGSAFDVSQWTKKNSELSGWQLLFSANFMIICFAFLFNDFLDTVGTVNGALVDTPLMKKDGSIPRLKKLLIADSLATLAGAVFGTSTTTTFAESAVGIKAGARTGLASLTGAILFLISLICAPVFLVIPGFATAPALIIVGFLMTQALRHIDWNDIAGALPAYLLVAGIVFTNDISNGLGFGIVSYTVLNCRTKGRVHWLMWILTLVFIGKYFCL